MTKRAFYITTAIDYVNSVPHLGTAYEKIAADVMARSRRMAGLEVFFSMGNDEHSQNVEREARAQGLEPRVYCDRMAAEFESTWKSLHIAYDRFVRTTEPAHRRAVEEVFRRIHAKGDIYKARYSGLYCVSCEAFYQEKDLVDGKCPQHPSIAPQHIEEENYFFALSRYRDRLLAHIAANPSFIQPEIRRNEIVRVLEGGLEDVSVSRAGKTWGIPLPNDPAHVTYVWFDALINYVTSAGFPDDNAAFESRWPADVHVIGKDITRFHCIIWPAMLLSAGIELPRSVFGHGFVSFKGERLSKSLGNIVRPLEAVERVGADALRYFLMREIVFGKDGDFSWEAFIGRYNADLANDLGNLLNRALSMVTRYLGGAVPAAGSTTRIADGAIDAAAADVRAVAKDAGERCAAAMERWEFSAALAATWELVRRANRLVEEAAPWTLASRGADARPSLEFALYHLLEACRVIAIQVAPVMPVKAEEMWKALGLAGTAAGQRVPRDLAWRDRWSPEWSSGRVAIGAPLFPRIEEKAAKDEGAGATPASKPGKPAGEAEPAATDTITYDDFAKVKLRVATIRVAERVPKTDKLLRLEIDLGDEQRQIVAGIGASYEPETLIGRQVIVVANLAPATLRGVRSEGMLLAASGESGSILLAPEKPAPPGAGVK